MLYYNNYSNYRCNSTRNTTMNDEEIEQTDIEILSELIQLNLTRICELEDRVDDLTKLIVGLIESIT